MAMITAIEGQFALGCRRFERHAIPDCATRRWIECLDALRRVVLEVRLCEPWQFAHPTYRHAARNFCMTGACPSFAGAILL